MGQSFQTLAQFRFQPGGAAGAPALEGVGGQDALFNKRPIANCQEAFRDNTRQLRSQGRGGEAEVIADYVHGLLESDKQVAPANVLPKLKDAVEHAS